MAGRSVYQSFVDPDQWLRADWLGTMYLHDPRGIEPPALGFIFQNEAEGRAIFEQWRALFGAADQNELLRVSIIEGDIPGQDPGYSVHVTTEPANLLAWARGQGIDDIERLAVLSQIKRNDHPDSFHLHRFKEHYAKHRRYLLIPATMKRQPEPHLDLAVRKTAIHFRQARDIPESDIDRAAFVR